MTDPLVVGGLHLGEWNFDFDRPTAEPAAIDPRIEVVVEPTRSRSGSARAGESRPTTRFVT